MAESEATETEEYTVVRNHEEYYSIWWTDRELPDGWEEVGQVGTKQECLDYIDRTWTDMRPLSLRTWMEEQERQAAGEAADAD